MKKLQLNISAMATILCAAGLAILGFSACESQGDMYGTPPGSFRLKGAVESKSGEPVNDAQITVKLFYSNDVAIPKWNTATGNDGKYSIEKENYNYGKIRIVCTPSVESGLRADSIDYNSNQLDAAEKSDGWTIQNFILDKKN